MSFALYATRMLNTALIAFEACPVAAVAPGPPPTVTCNCQKDPSGNPVPPHPVRVYPAQVPTKLPGGKTDNRTQLQWLQAHAAEFLAIVKDEATAAPPQLPPALQALIGISL